MSESPREKFSSPAASGINDMEVEGATSDNVKPEHTEQSKLDATVASSSASVSTADEEDEAEGGDDLFGAGDEDDDDEDDEVVSKPVRQRRQVGSASPSPSNSEQSEKAKKLQRRELSPSITPKASPTPSSRSAESYNALEHREVSAEPPMGVRDADAAPADLQEASFTLPSLPFRRGIPHYFARLPNLLQYRSAVFDEEDFDEEKEDEMLQNREGIRIDDEGLRSLLTTSNTIRWRWTEKIDGNGIRIPESNARIVKWDDGSSSLQLGSEFYDITQATERAQNAELKPSSSQSRLPLQPEQHLTHLFVKHDGQEQVNMYQSEAPIMGNFTFRPTSTTSDSHQRLAKAVRKQKGTLVKETQVIEDPELEKERKEKEEKKKGQKRMREMRKKMKGKEDEDDDAFWDSAARSARRTGARSMAINGMDEEPINGVEGGMEETMEDDGFVVDDEDEEDLDGEGSQEEDMEVDDEPDEMELMEAEMEKQEALRKAGKAGRSEVEESGEPLVSKEEDGAAASTTARKRRVIDSDEDEDE